MLKGTFHDPTTARNTTLHAALERYKEEVSPGKKGARQEIARIKYWQRHTLADKSLAALAADDFKKYIKSRREEGLADNTIRLSIAVVSHVFTKARQDWKMDDLENPLGRDRLKWPANSNERDRRVSEDEVAAILAATASPEMPTAFRLALESAMRRSEIVGLQWRYVDLEKRVAHLPRTKNGRKRDVPLSAAAVLLLAAIPGERRGNVFRFTADSFTQAFIRARKRARTGYEVRCAETGQVPHPQFLVDLRLHDSRHEATSGFFEKGLNTMEAATITGHRDLKMLKRYTHLPAAGLAPRLDPEPDAASLADPEHPGQSLRGYLPSGRTLASTSKIIGVPESVLTELLAGRARVDLDLALRLEALGPRAEMWLGLQSAFDVWLARKRKCKLSQPDQCPLVGYEPEPEQAATESV